MTDAATLRRLKVLERGITPLPRQLREQYYYQLINAEVSVYARGAEPIISTLGADTWLALRKACQQSEMWYIADAVDALVTINTRVESYMLDRYDALFTRWVDYIGKNTREQDLQWRMSRVMAVMDGVGIEPEVVDSIKPALRLMLSAFRDCGLFPDSALYSSALGDSVRPEFCKGELAFYEKYPVPIV